MINSSVEQSKSQIDVSNSNYIQKMVFIHTIHLQHKVKLLRTYKELSPIRCLLPNSLKLYCSYIFGVPQKSNLGPLLFQFF